MLLADEGETRVLPKPGACRLEDWVVPRSAAAPSHKNANLSAKRATSEVVRYLMRQALIDEGGIGGDGGDGQDKAAFALLTFLLGLGTVQGGLSLGIFDAFGFGS